MIAEDENLILCIDSSWSTDSMVVLQGWVLGKTEPVQAMEISVDGVQVPVKHHSRPDVQAAYPAYSGANCGFIAEIPRIARYDATFKVATHSSTLLRTLCLSNENPNYSHGFSDASTLFDEFVRKVNSDRLRVLEIGSRVVISGSSSKRSLFPNAASYTGFDYYPDDNTDVVGDAHQLSRYFEGQKFDAVFSCFVLEHLAMPWRVTQEINKVLEVGGLTFHTTHNAWPIHEYPWDFWRFSDQALKVLFSPPLGFEVVKAGYFEPVRMHFVQSDPDRGLEGLSMGQAFGGVSILATKTAEYDQSQFHWNMSVEAALGEESHYPEPDPASSRNAAVNRMVPAIDLTHRRIDPWGNVRSQEHPARESESQELQDKVYRLRQRVQNLKTKLEASENEIAAMKSSKFWQLRSRWIRFKTKFWSDS